MTGTWEFIIALVAVINALGVVRLLSAFAVSLRLRNSEAFNHYWVYYALGVFQLMVHVLFWWSIVGLRDTGEVNFLLFLYLLIGPTLLFLGSSILIGDVDGEQVDLQAHYLAARKDYYTILAMFWVWVIFIWPVFTGNFAPTVPLVIAFLVVALLLRFTESLRLHGPLMIVNWLIYTTLIVLYAYNLGAVGQAVAQP